jgi:hypothetical protein
LANDPKSIFNVINILSIINRGTKIFLIVVGEVMHIGKPCEILSFGVQDFRQLKR